LRIQTEKLKAAEDLAAAQSKLAAEQATARQQAERAAARAKRQFKIAAALGLFALAGAGAALWFSKQASRALATAERNAILSQAQALVAEARQRRDTRPVQSLLLASTAVETTRRRLSEKTVLPSARQTLLDALAGVGGHALFGHENGITCVALSSDNRWLVTGSDDKTARLWDLKAADPAAQPVVLKGHEDKVNAVAFSPDNRWVVTGSDDHTARLWLL
jgi:WD domain, G-beta repeat